VNAYLNPKTIDGSMALRNVKQFHDQSINSMRLSRTGNWLVTGEKNGVVKYFQPNIQLENIEELKKSVTSNLTRQKKIQKNTKVRSETLHSLRPTKNSSPAAMTKP
jgi:hypothetical protein